MTVIEVSVNRQRPGLVRKETDSPRVGREIPARKRKSSENGLMQQIQGYVYGDFLVGDSREIPQMAGKDLGPDRQTENILYRSGESISGLCSKRQKISSRIDLPQVRGRRKSRWKLKFHHQALPPEYLRHYKQQERKRRQTETKRNNLFKSKIRKIVKRTLNDVEIKSNVKLSSEEAVDGERKEDAVRLKTPGEAPQTQLVEASEELKIDAEYQGSNPKDRLENEPQIKAEQDILKSSISNISQLNIDMTQNKAFLENLLTNQIEINRVENKDRKMVDVKIPPFTQKANKSEEKTQRFQSIPSSGKIMNYSDLPYMGEITLDGIKPRRGRKPKKADICHLIYKNYGQVFPWSPGKLPESAAHKKQIKWKSDVSNGWNQLNSSQSTKVNVPTMSDRRLESPVPSVSGLINHTEVQNRIINSLLEKRLSQERRCKSSAVRVKNDPGDNREEPLNLCIRDLQSLKIKLSRKHGNFYETKSNEEDPNATTRKNDDDGIKKEMIGMENSDGEKGGSSEDEDEEDDLAPFNLVTTELRESSDEDTFLNFNDQITLSAIRSSPADEKEQCLRDDSRGNSVDAVVCCPGSNVLMQTVPVPSPLLYYQRLANETSDRINLTHSRNVKDSLLHPRKPLKYKPDMDRFQAKRVAAKPNGNAAHVITKRKRSAIFIPPVPAENTTNPTTEVSICKFKFTGGAKPSLQEKKMLSVDSGGNFRYYSGTGDKSMRGYEYFPRESLQQCQENTGCSPSGVFLTASALGSGEKIPEEIGHSGFFDSDFPIQVPPLKAIETRTRSKHRYQKKPEDHIEKYQTLREHLTSDRSDFSDVIIPDDLGKEDQNSSEDSVEGFDAHGMMQHSYFSTLKPHEDSIRGDECSLRGKKSRKSKKSLAREKLEQTFKEKGFLIQTQQLESAEGATYCKFRQLRKFTRYLFRSWKDYLPGNVRDLSLDAGVEGNKISVLPETTIKAEPCDSQGRNA